VYNVGSGRLEPTPEAFKYDDDDPADPGGRGCSVSSSQIAAECATPLSDIIPNWETHGLAYFQTSDVRQPGDSGVVSAPEPDNLAHALIRVRPLDKASRNEIWKPLRSRLRERAVYIDKEEHLAGYPSEPTLNL
jgi:hypothetical protein